MHIQNIKYRKWKKIISVHPNENKIYYENRLAYDFDKLESERIKKDVSIVCNLLFSRKINNLLCDAYASMAELEPFKEKDKY